MSPIHIYPAVLTTELAFEKKRKHGKHSDGNFNEEDELKQEAKETKCHTSGESVKRKSYKWEIVWRNVIFFTLLHILAIYGIIIGLSQRKYGLIIYSWFYALFISQGITAGAHRLWSHRAYKVKLPLKLLLLFLQTSAFQNSVYVWVRDHRLHHKYTDTDADPHNASRGFFFSHMGWLLVRKHKLVTEKSGVLYMDDITSDKILMFQHKNYVPLMILTCFVLPTQIPVYFFHEDLFLSFCIAGALRYTYSVHSTWLVNSAAHIFGMKPYDRTIGPCENRLVAFMACGEGFHNYHHVFPWDYKTSELGSYAPNWTLAAIDFFARIGWAHDLKTVSDELIEKRAKRTGDGSRIASERTKIGSTLNSVGNEVEFEKRRIETGSTDVKAEIKGRSDTKLNAGVETKVETDKPLLWGWGDEDMPREDIEITKIIN